MQISYGHPQSVWTTSRERARVGVIMCTNIIMIYISDTTSRNPLPSSWLWSLKFGNLGNGVEWLERYMRCRRSIYIYFRNVWWFLSLFLLGDQCLCNPLQGFYISRILVNRNGTDMHRSIMTVAKRWIINVITDLW